MTRTKREFLRKLALGAAYAVPVIATFSIDSVRSKAFAQGVYSAPEVFSIRAVPTTVGDGRYIYGDPPLTGNPPSFQTYQAYTLVITFSRPMNKSYNSAKICSIVTFSPSPGAWRRSGARCRWRPWTGTRPE